MKKKIEDKKNKGTRREFIHQASGSMGIVALGAAGWPLIDQMNPSEDVKAMSKIEVNLEELEEGNSMTILWRGKPLFIRYRTKEEIEEANNVKISDLPDPEEDTIRVKDPKYLVLIGVCTHLGCVPVGSQGEYDGWFCPCHGSHYDTSGRIRKGPAPKNLEVPPYKYISENTILVG